jgi:hypothetical protein
MCGLPLKVMFGLWIEKPDMVCKTTLLLAMCLQENDTVDHILANCPYARQLWFNYFQHPYMSMLNSQTW